MASVNKVTLIGNLGRDPEVRTFANGDEVCNLNIATSETWRDKNSGEKRERTEWHRVTVFGGLVKVAKQYLRKGSKVYLEGRLETRKWQDQSGADRFSTEVVLRPYRSDLVLLPTRQDGQDGQDGGGYGGSYDSGPRDQGGQSGAQGGGRELDDEIPF